MSQRRSGARIGNPAVVIDQRYGISQRYISYRPCGVFLARAGELATIVCPSTLRRASRDAILLLNSNNQGSSLVPHPSYLPIPFRQRVTAIY